jgi:hypothetical protein
MKSRVRRPGHRENTMPVMTMRRAPAHFVATALLGALMAGCSAGDVQLNGKLFDALGSVTGASATQGDVKVAPRAGLVVPPNLQNLPAPGSQAVPDGQMAEIVDHDRKKVVDKSALMAQQAEYCKVNYEQAKQRGDTTTADLAVGPMGSCRPSAMGLIDEINIGGGKQ